MTDLDGNTFFEKLSFYDCNCLHNWDDEYCTTCSENFTGMNCTECANSNFTGTYCDIVIPCTETNDQCQHGFNCTNNPEDWIPFGIGSLEFLDYTCHCNESWTGKNCEIVIPCSLEPCFGNSTCLNADDYLDYSCECTGNYIGKDCDLISSCMTFEDLDYTSCLNAGVCVDMTSFSEGNLYEEFGGAGYGSGYYGYGSGYLPGFNHADDNHGSGGEYGSTEFQQYHKIADYYCECEFNYNGTSCEQCSNIFQGENCTDCVDVTMGGDRCDIVIPCTRDPCYHNFTCTDFPDLSDFTCDCNETYTGKTCDTPIPCSDRFNPCLMNSTCYNSPDYRSFDCECQENYIGDLCDVLDSCVIYDPCQNTAPCDNSDTFNETLIYDANNTWIGYNSDFECDCSVYHNGTICDRCSIYFTGENCTECANTNLPRDIVFVMDASASVGEENYALQKEFVKVIGSYLMLTEEGTRAALVTYTVGDGDSITEFSFTGNATTFGDMVDAVEYHAGFTLTGVAMRHAYVDVIRYDSRPHAQVSMVVVTDGLSFDEVSDYADLLRDTNIDMYAVGVKEYELQQLQDIANVPWEKHLFTVPDFDDLPSIAFEVSTSICMQQHNSYNHSEVPANASCFSLPCMNGGSCVNDIDFTDFFCNCPQKYTGKSCEIPIPCEFEPCVNVDPEAETTCVNVDNFSDFECICSEAYGGKTCDILNRCYLETDLCLNGARCINSDESVYTNVTITNSTAVPLVNSDELNFLINVTNFECECEGFFAGDSCQTSFDPCTGVNYDGLNITAHPCLHGGNCTSLPDWSAYSCDCGDEYQGIDCEYGTTDLCYFHPCLNGGGCLGTHDNLTYTCDCGEFWTGEVCDIEYNCTFSPCENGGSCTNVLVDLYGLPIADDNGTWLLVGQQDSIYNYVDYDTGNFTDSEYGSGSGGGSGAGSNYTSRYSSLSSGFVCDCADVNYYGDNCEYYDSCDINPCENNGTCVRMGDDYSELDQK